MYLSFTLSQESKELLEEIYPETMEVKQLHHVTLFYNPAVEKIEELKNYFKDCEVRTVSAIKNDKAIVILVSVNGEIERLKDFPGFYHITHSHVSDVKPVYSNELLAFWKNGSPVEYVMRKTDLELKGTIEVIE
jgi:hypothetical protein